MYFLFGSPPCVSRVCPIVSSLSGFANIQLLPCSKTSGQTDRLRSVIAQGESRSQRDRFLMSHLVALSEIPCKLDSVHTIPISEQSEVNVSL